MPKIGDALPQLDCNIAGKEDSRRAIGDAPASDGMHRPLTPESSASDVSSTEYSTHSKRSARVMPHPAQCLDLTDDPDRVRVTLRGDGLLDITFYKAKRTTEIGIELAHSAAAGTYILKVLRGSKASYAHGLSKGVGLLSVNQVVPRNPEHAADMIRQTTGPVKLCVTNDVVIQNPPWSIFQAPTA